MPMGVRARAWGGSGWTIDRRQCASESFSALRHTVIYKRASTLMRFSLVTILGLVLGAAIGGTIANVTIPSHEQMRDFAADLVPPGTVTTDVSELTGFELLVGRYEAIAGFDTQDEEVTTVAAALRDHAVELGWTLVRIETAAGGEVQYWTRQQADASIYIKDFAGPGDGTIYVHYQESPTDRFLVGLALGGLLGLTLGLLLPRFVLRRIDT